MTPSTGEPGAAPRPTLRERRRADLTAEIKDAARRQLATEGLGALSLRGVARDVGMAVSALYRYFASRDDLVTALLVDAYGAHAEAVEAAVADAGEDPVDRFRAGLVAFRAWAVERPVEYGLMYGSPLPGYKAPTERLYGPGTRVAFLLYELAAEAERRGRLDLATASARTAALPRAHVEQLDGWRRRRVPDTSLDVVVAVVDVWTRLQGLVSLEVFGQLGPVLPDVAPYHLAALDQALAEAGFGQPPTRSGRE
ncbi:MAG: TetR/AcrR family transcriptional regulator [Phycicoccus sp.]